MLTSVSMTVGGVRGCPLRRGGGEQRNANQGDSSPSPFIGCFNMKHGNFAPILGFFLFQNETKWAFFASY